MAGCGGPPTLAFTLGTAHRDLTYCNSQTLDLYIPRVTGTSPLPLAIYVHGGGMTGGDKSELSPIFLDTLASSGYAVASVNYRLAPDSRYPAQIEDVKCAIRYLRAHATAHNLSRTEIVAFGTSVGGELVTLAALTGPHSVFDVGAYPTVPSTVVAVADMFGPANLTEPTSGFSPSALRDAFGSNTSKAVLASPTHFVAPRAPPVLIVHGVEDRLVHPSQSVELYRDLLAAGNQAQLILVQNMGHMFAQVGPRPIEPSMGQLAHDLVGFFDRWIGR